MKILLIQEKHPIDAANLYREAICMKNGFGVVDPNIHCVIWGPGFKAYDGPPQNYNEFDLIICLENYPSYDWLPRLTNVKHPVKLIWAIDTHCQPIEKYINMYHKHGYDYLLCSIKRTCDFISHKYGDLGKKTIFFGNAVDNTLFAFHDIPKYKQKPIQIGFCGRLIGPRAALLGQLHWLQGYKLYIGQYIYGYEFIEFISKIKLHFNYPIGNEVNYRVLESAIVESIPLVSKTASKELSYYGFEHEVNCLLYDPHDFVKCIHNIIIDEERNIEKYQRIANNAVNHVLRNHTYIERCKQILDIYYNHKHS